MNNTTIVEYKLQEEEEIDSKIYRSLLTNLCVHCVCHGQYLVEYKTKRRQAKIKTVCVLL